MIPRISELNFPEYATLNTASVSLSDMGEKVITASVKIDGDVTPSFIGTDGNDWAVEFNGEKYIHPLRKPQAKKDNSSRNSIIEMTFYHWAIYQMKRFYFVSLANVSSGTPMVDKYVVPIALTLPQFAKYLDDLLAFYLPDRSVYVYQQNGSYINPNLQDYDHEQKFLSIDYSYIWDVLQKTYEYYDCHWSIEPDGTGKYCIKFGYPVSELSHIFQYGFDGGLLSVERQVQDANIRNQILGRGGEKNLPYMYFKNYEKFHPNSQDSAYQNIGLPDPDAIPELENILFSELRDSNFRSYVQGWKVNPHRQASTTDGWSVTWTDQRVFTESDGTTYSYDAARAAEDWAYAKGASDEMFDPVEYVKDDDSIETFGLLQGGLANDEEAYPTIQGMKVEVDCVTEGHTEGTVITDADEVVDVEEVATDVIYTGGSETGAPHLVNEVASPDIVSNGTFTEIGSSPLRGTFTAPLTTEVVTEEFAVEEGYLGNIIFDPVLNCFAEFPLIGSYRFQGANGMTYTSTVVLKETAKFDAQIISWGVYDASTNERLNATTNLPSGAYYIKATISIPNRTAQWGDREWQGRTVHPTGVDSSKVKNYIQLTATCDSYNFYGEVVKSNVSGTQTIDAGASGTINLIGEQFSVPESGALYVWVPVDVSPAEHADHAITIRVLDVNTHQYVVNSSLPQGTYEIRATVEIKNTDTSNSHTFTARIGAVFLYYNRDQEDWKPTFDIWIKNIFGTDRGQYTTDEDYTNAVWSPLVSTQEMAVTFTTGNLHASSDWEFKVNAYAYDNSKILTVEDEHGVQHDVRSEWRLTLIKTDAEADAIHQYVPYRGYNAAPHDKFFFTGIYLPWPYVYAAEQLLNTHKTESLDKTKDITPTWVVGMDKVRINTKMGQEASELIEQIGIGDQITLKDKRFLSPTGIKLYVQSITYSWNESTLMYPDVEVVLSDNVETAMSTVQQIQSDIQAMSSQLKGISNLERTIRKVGDSVYLRKDGFEDTSYSPTTFAKEMKSDNYRSGIIGGSGWFSGFDSDGNSMIEVDKIRVRKEMEVNNLVINQISAMGGKEILSAASIRVSRVEPSRVSDKMVYLCYFDQHNGTIGNLFQVGDVAFSQVFDSENNETKYYKRKVVGVGEDYIALSDEDGEKNGSGIPQEGDVVAHYGSYTTPARQYIIIRDVIGGGYERMLSNLDSVEANGKEYYFSGLDSTGARWFVGDHNNTFAEYKNGQLVINARVQFASGSAGLSNIDGYADLALDSERTIWENINGVASTTQGGTKGSYFETRQSYLEYQAGTTPSPTSALAYGSIIVSMNGNVPMFDSGELARLDIAYNNLKSRLNQIGLYSETPDVDFDREELAAKLTEYYDAENSIRDTMSLDTASITKWFEKDTDNITTIDGGVILTKLLGVRRNDKMVAGLNASNRFDDPDRGSLMIFAGANGATGVANAPFRVYDSGDVIANRLKAQGADIAGKITSTEGKIGDFDINENNIEAAVEESVLIPVTRRMRLNHDGVRFTDDTYKVSGSVGTSITPSSGTQDLDVFEANINRETSYKNIGYSANIRGSSGENLAFHAENGLFSGFRPKFEIISSGQTITINDFTTFVLVNGNATVNLPTSPKVGHYIVLVAIPTATNGVRINGGNKSIQRLDTNTTATSTVHSDVQFDLFFYDGTKWVMTSLEIRTR